jgi:hypothetical protein
MANGTLSQTMWVELTDGRVLGVLAGRGDTIAGQQTAG